MNEINFTRRKLVEFKRLYNQAVIDKKEQFLFEGHEVLVSYAKYMIEYLDGQFGIKPENN